MLNRNTLTARRARPKRRVCSYLKIKAGDINPSQPFGWSRKKKPGFTLPCLLAELTGSDRIFINKKHIITILHSFNVFMEAIVVTQAWSGGVTILLGQQNCLFVYDVRRARKTSEKLQRMNWLYIFT